MSLGDVDFGLFGLVGGLSLFVSMLNEVMASAVSRYYAVAVGEANAATDGNGVEICRKWFNSALLIHTVLPIALVCIGYPFGLLMVRNFLAIPTGSMGACVWVWRFTCVSCLVAMLNVPFRAMYTAKQEIAELTIYQVAQTVANVCFLYYMVTHPGRWLARYAAWACAVAAIPQFLIAVRAVMSYPECKLVPAYLVCRSRFMELIRFASFRFWGAISGLAEGQGESVVVNKYFGPVANAAKGISLTVISHMSTLANSLNNAFAPAIMNYAGAGQWDKVRVFSFRVCKIGAVMMLVFVVPASAEIGTLLELWLGSPPQWTAELCLCAMVGAVLEQMTEGYSQAIFANGRIGGYQFWIGNSCFAAFGASWLFAALGFGVVSIGIAYIILKVLVIIIRLYYGRKILGYAASEFIQKILFPMVCLSIVGCIVARVPRIWLAASFVRIIFATLLAELAIVPVALSIVLTADERQYLWSRLKGLLPHA